jgi:hypothetical protein
MDLFKRSVLKPEGSIIGGVAVAGSVWAIYNMNVGPVSTAHASDANHSALESSRKKSGYTAFIFVSAITLIAKDVNIGILGFASIIAMELNYRHAIMVSPTTGIIQPPAESSYTPAGGNVIDMSTAGATSDGPGYTG